MVANPAGGFLVTDSGGGFTWAGNSQLYRLTPWSNDPISDPPAEVVYLRDEETGHFWTPTPRPAGGPTETRHGHGYTTYTADRNGLISELTVFDIDFDTQKDAVRAFGARMQSTLIVFKGGVEVGRASDLDHLDIDAQGARGGPHGRSLRGAN